jgi:acylphosphatase
MTRRVHLVVSGLVQGVGFRMFIERSARELQLAGMVRNLPDGTVEIDVQGPEQHVEALIRKAECGPGRSRVTGIRKQERKPDSTMDRFSIVF